MACNRHSATPSTTPSPPLVPILFIYHTIRLPSEKVDYTISFKWHSQSHINKMGTNGGGGEVEFVHFLIQIVSYQFIQQAARAKPEHTSCPDQAAPGCPDVRVHPAAPTLGYTWLPRPLGYTRLPRPVRVRSWGGWVRNGIKITIRKLRLYKFIRVAYYSQPLRKYGIISGNYHKQICWAYSKLQEKVG